MRRKYIKKDKAGIRVRQTQGAMAQLSHKELLEYWQDTLETPSRPDAKILFSLPDLLYEKERTLSKFKILELVARVPYQSWEQVSYMPSSIPMNARISPERFLTG
ncbi:MAG: hypothetical protein M1374_02210 [Firmicutes bacterium]|nr:hypothetical protein [Bacillota bacterium]